MICVCAPSKAAQTPEIGIASPRKPIMSMKGVFGIRKWMALPVGVSIEGSVRASRSFVSFVFFGAGVGSLD